MTPAERMLLLLLASKALIPPADHPAHQRIGREIAEAMRAVDGEAAAEHADRGLLRLVARLAVAAAVPGYVPLAEVGRMAGEVGRLIGGEPPAPAPPERRRPETGAVSANPQRRARAFPATQGSPNAQA